MSLRLDRAPTMFRTQRQPLAEAPDRVDREARVISGVSVITRGEALGHELWIDEQFLNSLVADALTMPSGRGIKSRFAHPGLSSDGTGKVLGRFRRLRRSGDKVLGDLHLAASAERAPSGDLAGYVLDLAEEDPGLFGTSIVFERDQEAESEHYRSHLDDSGEFRSPDPRNTENLPHARLRLLKAVDVVDDPAANPDGFFSQAGDVVTQAEAALSWLLGLSERSPGAAALGGIHPERARQFVSRYLTSRGLAVGPHRKEAPSMDANDVPGTEPQSPAAGKVAASLDVLEAKFSDPGFVLAQLKAGASIEEAESAWLKRENELLKAELAAAKSQAGRVQAESAAKAPSGEQPMRFGATDGGTPDLLALATQIRDERQPHLTSRERLCGVGMREAMAIAVDRYPQAAAAYKA